jgi:DNA modification methylase
MDGEQAALCATDPPYLVDYTGERPDHDGGNEGGKDWSDTYREVEITDADGFFRGVFTNVLRVLAPNSAVYCWHAHKRQALIARVWEDLGILDHQQIVWVKPTAVFGRVFWHFRHEPCMMGWRQGSMPEHDSDHQFNSVWEIDWEGKKRVVGNEHPTQKPVEIFARPMRKHTKPGDVVFEPFSGSGSQLVAAEQQGRRCRAMELEPRFVDVALARWSAFTNKAPVRASDGAEFIVSRSESR